MTLEQFKQEYRALMERREEIDDRISALKEEYAKSLPFKEGDTVCVNGWFGTLKGVIIYVCANKWNIGRVSLKIAKFKKDGTPSKIIQNLPSCDIKDIEVIER